MPFSVFCTVRIARTIFGLARALVVLIISQALSYVESIFAFKSDIMIRHSPIGFWCVAVVALSMLCWSAGLCWCCYFWCSSLQSGQIQINLIVNFVHIIIYLVVVVDVADDGLCNA